MSPSELDAAMGRVAGGDQRAFAKVYDELSPVVFGVILRVLRDPNQAEEVLQETFVQVWRTAASFDATRGSARAWAVTIGRRRAIDRVRAEVAHRRRHETVATSAPSAAATGADEFVLRSVEADVTRQRLDGLTDVQRATIELAFYEGLTQREIADRLRVPLGTVKTRMRDGLATLRRQMGDRP